MRKNTIIPVIAFAFLMVIFSCKKNAEEAATTEAEAATEAKVTSQKYQVDHNESSVAWTGYKPTGKHFGIINVDSGLFTVNNGVIESGSFIINMNSITVLDIPETDEKNADLAGHLKSADFFETETYPTAIFEVTGFEEKDGKAILSGNLTMKGETNNVSFPVTVTDGGNSYTIFSDAFSIDRTKWNVNYKSKTVFNLEDRFINDNVDLQISVKGTKS